MAGALLDFFQKQRIDIQDCCDQSYNNVLNTSEKYKLIHIRSLKFFIVITVFKSRRQISISNTKYWESPFEELRVRKNDY